MSIETNSNVDTDDTNLDDFSAEFFGQTKAEPEPTNSESDNEEEDSTDAPPEADQDTQDASDEDDTTDESEEDTTESDEEEEEAPAPKPKKNSAQERIAELNAKWREEQRARDQERREFEARIAALEGKTPKDGPTPTAQTEATEVSPPKPTDVNEDGTEKYPLGEFDPNFITDLADFRVEQRFAERERLEQEKAAQAKQQEAMGQLEASWNEQIGTAKERYPDYDEKISNLQPVFSDVDGQYGDYLSSTLMSMEKGADILYYLADHPDEARAIVDSGPQRATVALGRLEARFLEGETSAPARKASKAPPPPPTNKGASSARGTIPPDTDDLDAFSDMFFKK